MRVRPHAQRVWGRVSLIGPGPNHSAGGTAADEAAPPLQPSPLRRTRSRGLAPAGLPMQPTQSMVADGLEALGDLGSLERLPSFAPEGVLPGSPMRRTRSKGLPGVPLQASISEMISSFMDG